MTALHNSTAAMLSKRAGLRASPAGMPCSSEQGNAGCETVEGEESVSSDREGSLGTGGTERATE